MILLGTEEAEKRFAQHNLSLTRDEIRTLAREGVLKHIRLDNNRIIIEQSVVDDYARERLAQDDLNNSSPGNRKWSLKNNLSKLLILKWRLNRKGKWISRLSFLVPAALLILFSIVLVLLPREDKGSHSASVISFMLAVAVMYALWPFISDFRDATAQYQKLTVTGLPVLFFGVALASMMAHYYDSNLRSELNTTKEDVESLSATVGSLGLNVSKLKKQKSQLLMTNGIYESFTDNLPALLNDSRIHAPMTLSLKISCIGQQRSNSFWYTSYKPVYQRDSSVADTKINVEEQVAVDLPFSKGEFLIHKSANSAVDLVASVYFDNSSILAPRLEVEVGRERLCEEYAPEPTDAASLSSALNDLSTSGLEPIQYAKRMNDYLALADASNQGNQRASIGDALVLLAEKHMRSEHNAALDVLRSLQTPWMSTSTRDSVDMLKVIANQATQERKNEIDFAIKNSEISGRHCDGALPVSHAEWERRLKCLDAVPEQIVTAYVIYDKAIALMAVTAGKPDPADTSSMLQSAEQLTNSAEMFDKQSHNGNTQEENYLNDAYTFASIAFYLSGDSQSALKAISKLNEASDQNNIYVDPQIIMAPLTSIIDYTGESRIPTHQLIPVLADLYNDSTDNATDSITHRLTDLTTVTESMASKGFQLIYSLPLDSEEQARKAASELLESVATNLPELAAQYPALREPDTYGHSPPIVGGEDKSYRVRIGSQDRSMLFSRKEACLIMREIETVLNIEMSMTGPVQPSNCSIVRL